jgi:hypothetical protein
VETPFWWLSFWNLKTVGIFRGSWSRVHSLSSITAVLNLIQQACTISTSTVSFQFVGS